MPVLVFTFGYFQSSFAPEKKINPEKKEEIAVSICLLLLLLLLLFYLFNFFFQQATTAHARFFEKRLMNNLD